MNHVKVYRILNDKKLNISYNFLFWFCGVQRNESEDAILNSKEDVSYGVKYYGGFKGNLASALSRF